ncbi:E3 ubiquitin-protein ligase RNF125 isoform X1 [Zalophus californianus]|uniref:E3 ubiquitin-protein ligase RNF125 n=1 Tax=Zalophus californianus TaxID=9704 RepID=A0A6J2BRZ8_ZALCA|nr:E3 ubiquitin-protein ligase RNF125 isoform X1 [Zalophus californianus]XP_027953999.1 E3 ubiquitin-protein ligase RNF125 isoform X1 [Eumetopias jubatus]
MGSVLSSDSGKSAPASTAPRALERKGDPELPVTSFDCSVCLEVLHQPVRTRCGHVFCRSCIATSLKNNKWTCPYCRAYLPSEGVPATDVAKRMKSEYQNCTECDTPVCLSEMRAHIRSCEKYIDKYGPLQELGETATRCVCPFCQRELDEDSLLDHCITHHRSERRSVFCPLCRLLPNENPGSFSGSLIRHLQVSHTLFYDDFIRQPQLLQCTVASNIQQTTSSSKVPLDGFVRGMECLHETCLCEQLSLASWRIHFQQVLPA